MLEQIIPIIREAGRIVLSARDAAARTREKTSAADLVTEYDLAVEAFLKEKLPPLVPKRRRKTPIPAAAGPSSSTPSTAPLILSGACARAPFPRPWPMTARWNTAWSTTPIRTKCFPPGGAAARFSTASLSASAGVPLNRGCSAWAPPSTAGSTWSRPCD